MTIPRDMQRTLITAGLAALIGSGVTGGGAAVVRAKETEDLQTTVRKTVRDEMSMVLATYVTKDSMQAARDSDRDRLEQLLGGIRTEMQRLALAVERLRR